MVRPHRSRCSEFRDFIKWTARGPPGVTFGPGALGLRVLAAVPGYVRKLLLPPCGNRSCSSVGRLPPCSKRWGR